MSVLVPGVDPTRDLPRPSEPRPRRRVARLAVVAGVVLSLVISGSAAAWDAYAFSAPDEQQLLVLVNQARANAGLPPFVLDATLASIARSRSKDMYDRDYLSHTNPDGQTAFDMLQAAGWCYASAGEVIGKNDYPDDQTSQVMFDAWMSSPGHHAILMGADTRIGFGAFKGDGRNGGTDTTATPDHLFTGITATPCGPGSTPTPAPRPRSTEPAPTSTTAPDASTAPADGNATAPEPEDPGATLAKLDTRLRLIGLASGPNDGDGESPPASVPGTGSGAALAVVDPVPSEDLLDALVGGIAAAYLGH